MGVVLRAQLNAYELAARAAYVAHGTRVDGKIPIAAPTPTRPLTSELELVAHLCKPTTK